MIALFSVVSCKHDPEPQPQPQEQTGKLVVKPAADATYSQDNKFQFKIAVEYNELEPISFYVKCSDDVTVLDVREGGNGDTYYIKNIPIADHEKTADGWYIISIPADKVTPAGETADSLGITARITNDKRDNCFVEIRNLRFNDVAVDFLEHVDDNSFVSAYATSPDKLDVSIIEEN